MSAGSLFWELTRISHQGVEGRGFSPAVSGGRKAGMGELLARLLSLRMCAGDGAQRHLTSRCHGVAKRGRQKGLSGSGIATWA
jgi:hypothetical protein